MIRALGIILMGLLLPAGCGSFSPPTPSDASGRVIYVDGAGGGWLSPWALNVELGLRAGGFDGGFETFIWNTGFGLLADQVTSVDYKQAQGARLARRIEAVHRENPNAPLHLVAFSAGSAVTAYALAELPDDVAVNQVVFLASSLDAHFDLTEALVHVDGELFVFTSPADVMLAVAIPLVGTADRATCGACAAGLSGFHEPSDADAAPTTLYGKIVIIPWQPAFAATGHWSGHTDVTHARFIEAHIAPLLTIRAN
jgi:pimeloyl-ACP methyl ester carboxylesterase